MDAAVLDALPLAVIVTDLAGRIFLWNRAAEHLYGYRKEQMLGATVLDLFVWPDDQDSAQEIMGSVLAGGTWTGEFPVRRADGTTRLVRITDAPLYRGEEIVGVVGAAEDISEERAAQVVAADRAQQLRVALDAAELGTWQWELTTGVTTWDTRLESMFGLPPGGFDGTFERWVSLIHADDRERVLADVDRAVADRSMYEVRHRVPWPDGSVHWIEGVGQVTLGPDGAVTGMIGCSRDVTERVAVEQRLDAARMQFERIADRLQAGLGPDDVPHMAGVDVGAVYRAGGEAAEHVGGDWFDVLPQHDGSVVLVVGDVMGRGVDAATTMSQVRGAIRAFVSVDASPDVVLGKLDRFAATQWPEEFVTVVYARLDPDSRQVAIASAGHLPAVALAPGGEPVLLELQGSPPIGLAATERVVRREQLRPGTALLVVTDGLVEQPGLDLLDELRGAGDRLLRLLGTGLSAQTAAEALVAEAGPADRGDDITVLVARLSDR